MTINSAFLTLCTNSSFDFEDVGGTIREITKKLNSVYYGTSSDSDHCVIAGSLNRGTAINCSDVDFCYILPKEVYDRFSERKNNIQSQLLQEIKQKLNERYPNSDIVGDGQVVDAKFIKRTIEIVPSFTDPFLSNYLKYPDTHNDGKWLFTSPENQNKEVEKFSSVYPAYRNLCKIIRCWKVECKPSSFSGILIDTLVYKFLSSRFDSKYKCDIKNFDYFSITREFFDYLDSYECPENVTIIGETDIIFTQKDKFIKKVRKAKKKLCEQNVSILWDNLLTLFGPNFPDNPFENNRANNEQFIYQLFPLKKTSYNLDIDCKVSDSFYTDLLSFLEEQSKADFYVPKSKNLDFYISFCDVPQPYDIYWKVKNVGKIAREKNQLRGNIIHGDKTHHEKSTFKGPHFVECFIIKDGFCVASKRIEVPIE